jgi:hypothetical protein
LHKLMRSAVVGALATSLAMYGSSALAHTTGEPGDEIINVHINDSAAGGSYHQDFEQVYAGTSPDGTPVYIYVPEGALGGADGVDSMDPGWDPNPGRRIRAVRGCRPGRLHDHPGADRPAR